MDATNGETSGRSGGDGAPPLPPPPRSSWTPRMPVAAVGPEVQATNPALLARPSRRFGGFLIDALVLLVPTIVLLNAFLVGKPEFTTYGYATDPTVEQMQQLIHDMYVSMLLLALLYLTYTVLFVRLRGQTPGKMAVGVRVEQVEDGERPSWGRALGRSAIPTVAWFLPGAGVLAILLVYLWMLWDPKRQGLHDKVVRTVVVRTRSA